MKGSICSSTACLRDVMEAINQEPYGIAFIIGENQKLVGVLTDGDIRRMLLNGASLDSKISTTKLGNFVFALEGEQIESVLGKTNERVSIVPIVNSKGQLVNYFKFQQGANFIPIAEPSLKGNELNYASDAILSTWISSRGKYIDRFESEFAAYSSTNYGVAVSNGTVAIHLALVALGVGAGDEVIVPDLTFAATINAVLHAGATPVIVDVEKDSWCISPSKIAQAVTKRTKAVIAVHLYGQPCDMVEIMHLSEKYGFKVLEDAAEAHGATYLGKKVGSFGHISTFSFFGNKIITCGEGGMVLTNSKELNDKLRILRDHGMSTSKKYWHDVVGFNYRMTNVQAAIGCAQLERIEQIHEWRRCLEENYRTIFRSEDVIFQKHLPGRERARWLVSMLAPSISERDLLIDNFRKYNVDLRPFFYPLSSMPIYSHFKAEECLVSKELSERGVSLPTLENVNLETIKMVLQKKHEKDY